MRTTITLDDRLLRAAKRLAAQRGTTLSQVIADALRAQLVAKPVKPGRPFKLVVFKGDGPHDGVDLDRTSALDALDDVRRYGEGRGASR
jgi:hypothetical protein